MSLIQFIIIVKNLFLLVKIQSVWLKLIDGLNFAPKDKIVAKEISTVPGS